jgi:hypothetical protein
MHVYRSVRAWGRPAPTGPDVRAGSDGKLAALGAVQSVADDTPRVPAEFGKIPLLDRHPAGCRLVTPPGRAGAGNVSTGTAG